MILNQNLDLCPEILIYIFLDSTFLRIWSKDNRLLMEIKEFLSTLNSGHLIDEQERIKYGVTNREFGDLIFRAEEGVMFFPNFWYQDGKSYAWL